MHWYITSITTSLKHLLTPQSANGYQANLLKPYALLSVVTGLILLILTGFSTQQHRSILGAQDTLTESHIIALTNLERTLAGLPPLHPNPLLTQAAMAKANNMFQTDNFDHYYQSEQGQPIDPWQFILDSGYNYRHAGENLGRNFYTGEELVQAWMNSPAHKANLLSTQYTEIGIAVITGEFQDKPNSTLIVQFFATPLPPGVMATDQQQPFNTAPLIERQDTWLTGFLNGYPIIIFLLSALITVTVGVSLLIDLTKGRKLRQKHLSSELWLR